MNIAVLGATGMLGNHTARAIAHAGHNLTVLHRSSSNLSVLGDISYQSHIADTASTSSISEALKDVDAVIHCAAYYPTVPRKWQEDVRLGMAQMEMFYEACAEAMKAGSPLNKIVYCGGAIALKRTTDGVPAKESDEYAAQPDDKNAYIQVKWAMDDLAKRRVVSGLPVCIGIPAMTFGEFDYGPTTGRLLVEITNGTLAGYLRGNRNVIYAGDAGRGLLAVAERGRVGERYLLTGENLSMDALTQMIGDIAGVKPPPAVPLPAAKLAAQIQEWKYKLGGEEPKLTKSAIAVMAMGQFLDGSKAAQELGFKAEISVREALKRAHRWFRDQGMIRK
jgi:dihydroflavonol-4-reductase